MSRFHWRIPLQDSMMINFRKIVSLTLLFSFIFVLFTGCILFISPEGRIAYWVNWEIFKLSKTQYSELHKVGVLLFIICSILHIYFNFNVILSYFRNGIKKASIFNPNIIVSLIITIIFILGGLYKFPLLGDFLNISSNMKEYWSEKYESPPFGHAERSGIKSLCEKMDIDFEKAKILLTKKGITIIDDDETLLELAQRAGTIPAEIYKIIELAKIEGSKEVLTGLGKMTLEEVCIKYNIDLNKALETLTSENFIVNHDSKLKELSSQKGLKPIDIYNIIN